MDRRREGDQIAKIESVPPPDDDAYAAPTKVGEAAYRMLAEGMAAFDAPPPSRQPDAPPPQAPGAHGDDGTSSHVLSPPQVPAHGVVSPPAMMAPPPAMMAPPPAMVAPPPAMMPATELPPSNIWPGAPAAFSRVVARPEIVIAIVSFLAVALPALAYLLLR